MTDFWIILSAVGTLAMAAATFIALRQNKGQLDELKRQWHEEHKARIVFSVEIHDSFFCLKIENTGKSVANLEKIEINKDFLDKMFEVDGEFRKSRLENLCANPLRIAPGVSKCYQLCSIHENELKSTPIKITFTYDGVMHTEDFVINDYEYIRYSWIIESGTEKNLRKIEEQLRKIEKIQNGGS